jgi:hypothetical protein
VTEKEKLEAFNRERSCDRCQFSEPSFNLLWCVVHDWTVASNETCHSFEKKYGGNWLTEMAKRLEKK